MAKLTSVLGNSQKLDGGSMFGNCPRAVWEKWLTPDDLGRVELACRCLLIEEDDGRKVLLETGIGAFFEPKLAARFGVEEPSSHKLLDNLGALGVKPSDIDVVVLSHLHFDHAGGLLPAFNDIEKSGYSLVFSNAKIVVGKDAFARGNNPHMRDKASFIPELMKLLQESQSLEIVEGSRSETLGDAYEFIYTDGHTPGQMHTLFKGEQGSIFFCGDLVPGTAWVHIPITMGYDRYPEKLIDEKIKIMNRAVAEDWFIYYTHDPYIACSKIKKDDRGKYKPFDAIKVLESFKI